MKNTKRSILLLAVSCVAAFGQSAETDFKLPLQSLGLDYASAEIDKGNSALEDASGMKFFFNYYGNVLSNPYGGDAQGTAYTQELVYGVNADLDRVVGWRGASFVISGAYCSGQNLSDKIGNFFTASETYITHGAVFYEMYLSQKVDLPWDDSLEIRLGRMSMSDIFGSLPAFGYLVSGGMDGTPEAIFANSPYTSSPTAAWAACATYSTAYDLAFSSGLYQIKPSMSDESWHGTDFGINSDDGYMAMFQTTWTPTFCKDSNGGYSGIYSFGGYFFGGCEMPDFAVLNENLDSGYGFYLQGQQTVWVDSHDKDRYVSVWAGAQYAPKSSAAVMSWMTYAGVQLQGFVPSRSRDGIFLSWLTGWFGGDYSNNYSPVVNGYVATCETVLEATYVFWINTHIAIQPDVQYIISPYGNPNGNDALVIGGQFLVSF